MALLMLVPAGYIGVQMVQVLRTNYQTQTAVAYSMSDVVRCDGMLAMDETVIPYEGAGVLGRHAGSAIVRRRSERTEPDALRKADGGAFGAGKVPGGRGCRR